MTQARPRRRAIFGQDRFCVVSGARVHFVEAGRGPTLVLLPGVLETYRTFAEILPRFGRRSRCFAIDLLGQGDTTALPDPRYDIPTQAEVVAALIEQLDISPVGLLGTGLGGSIAINLAARRPDLVTRAISLEGVVAVEPGANQVLRRLAWLGDGALLGPLANQLLRAPALALPVAWHRARGRWSRLGWSERFRLAAESRVMLSALDMARIAAIAVDAQRSDGLAEAAAGLRVPLLHLLGERSPTRPAQWRTREILADIDAAHLGDVVGAGAELHRTHPGWLAEVATVFLRDGRLPPAATEAESPRGVSRFYPDTP